MKKYAWIIGAVALLWIQPAFSGPIYYTDFGSFDAATNTTIVEDFEGISPKDAPQDSFTNNGITYQAISSDPRKPNVWVSSPGYPNYGVVSTASSILTATGDENFSVEFSVPTQVVGFDTYLNNSPPANIQIFSDTNLIGSYDLTHPADEIGFFGVVSDEMISSIQWTTENGRQMNTGIDNIRTGAPIPEPGTIFLMAAGVLGLGVFRKMKK